MCMECVKKGTKRLVGSTTDEEYKSFMILINKRQCTNAIVKPEMLPDDIQKSEGYLFFKKAVVDQANAVFLMEKWFIDVAKRLGVKNYWDLEIDEKNRLDNLFMPIGVE